MSYGSESEIVVPLNKREVVSITLIPEELELLEKEVTGSGGFQTLFRKLKDHLNNNALTLTADVATLVIRYTSGNYVQSGFHDRLKKLPTVIKAAYAMEEAGDYLPDAGDEPSEFVVDDEGISIEDNLGEKSDETPPMRYAITSYGADYTADKLVERLERGDIYVPDFQRGYVWKHKQASRFIESLLLGLPVPGIFVSREADSKRLIVIDGQQRLRTLQYFYRGEFGRSRRKFALRGVGANYEGKTYESLLDDERRQLDDSIIHATVIRQEEPTDDQSSIYHVFERLNTGGTQLHSQEIRACIYHGALNDLLRELNNNHAWRAIYGEPQPRMRDQELILRFLALYYDLKSYKSPMKGFLNKFMGRNRHVSMSNAEEIRNVFESTIETLYDALGNSAFKRFHVLNAAVFDAVMVGLARRISAGPTPELNDVRERYDLLVKKPDFVSASQFSTADESNVERRLALATEAFAAVK